MWTTGTPREWTSAARWQVLLLLYPPTTTMRSSGSSSSATTASCRSWVAEQMVSNERKWRRRVIAVAADHALPDLLGDRQRFAREHRGLIRDPDPVQVAGEVEARRDGGGEPQAQRLGVAALLDEIADQPRLRHVQHHEVAAAGILHHLAGGRLGLLVVVLAVDDRGEAVAGVALHPLPDVEHRAAGGIDQHAADRPQTLEVADGHSEGRQDDDVVGGDAAEVEFAGLAPEEELHAHVAQLLVDMGIVDDLADQEQPPVGELDPGLIGVIDRPVHSVAEPEFPGEPEGQRPGVEPILIGAKRLDHGAVVVGGELSFDLGLEPEPAAEVGALHGPNLTPSRPVPRPRSGRRPAVGSSSRAGASSSGTSVEETSATHPLPSRSTETPSNDPVTLSRLPSEEERSMPENRPDAPSGASPWSLTDPLSPRKPRIVVSANQRRASPEEGRLAGARSGRLIGVVARLDRIAWDTARWPSRCRRGSRAPRAAGGCRTTGAGRSGELAGVRPGPLHGETPAAVSRLVGRARDRREQPGPEQAPHATSLPAPRCRT